MGQRSPFAYDGPAELQTRIEDALRWVMHPHLGVNVLDAGLVYRIQVDDERVCVSLTMTTPGCPLAQVISEDIEAELFDHLANERRVEVKMVWWPVWTPARMKVVPIGLPLSGSGQAHLTRINMNRRPSI